MITVITATLPERMGLLAEAVASVNAQALRPSDHLIRIAHERGGGARSFNILASAVNTEWIAVLPDDDLLYPAHLERLAAHSTDADVVYSYCDTTGDNPWDHYNQPFDASLLRQLSIVSHVALIRTDLVVSLGGWDEGPGYDYRFWLKALDAGARFRSVPERTWLYRLEAGWKHESRPWV